MDQECLIGWPESIKSPPDVCGYEFKVRLGCTFFSSLTEADSTGEEQGDSWVYLGLQFCQVSLTK